MSSDFVVVINVRQHFGDNEGHFGDGPTFAGSNKRFTFDCPSIDQSAWSYMMFQSRDVDLSRNRFAVNGHDIFGGIPVTQRREDWNANVALINPGWLEASNNDLLIGARNEQAGVLPNIDDFLIDNLVVQYRTRSNPFGLLRRFLRF